MIILGLTGSIGMGKSTAAQRFRERNVPVLDADQVVHDLYSGDAAPEIEEAFPGTVSEGVVDRALLAKHLMEHPEDFKKLEAIIHPMVRQEQYRFIIENAEKGTPVVVLEIPLLLEGGKEGGVDAVVVVSAEDRLRRERVMQRPGMTEEKFEAIIARQMPDSEKVKKADFVVDTSGNIEETWEQVDKILESLGDQKSEAAGRWEKEFH